MADRSSEYMNLTQPPQNRNSPSNLSSLFNWYRKFCTSQALAGHRNPLRRERAAFGRSFIPIKTNDGVYCLQSFHSGFTLKSPPTYAFWLHDNEPDNRRVQWLEMYVTMLEREGYHLRSDIASLELKLAEGHFSASITKVLRKKQNPVGADNETTEAIQALENELLVACERLQAVEELAKDLSDAGPHVGVASSVMIIELEDQIVELGNREETYRAAFHESISVFRRACCELFGYEIAMHDHVRSNEIPVPRFVLHSVYTTGDDEKLIFEYDSGNVYLVENNYTLRPQISEKVNSYVRQLNSIPAFLANQILNSPSQIPIRSLQVL